MYFWLVSLSFSFSIGLTSVVHLYFIFWWIGIHSLRKPNDTQTTKVWTKKRHRKWSQDKWDQNLTHQNKTIQLTLAIHSDGPGSKLHDQHRDSRTVKTKTHIRYITSFEQQNFDIAQSLVEAWLMIAAVCIPHL